MVNEQTGTTTQVSDAPVPAVAIKKSVFPDYIVCLEDGKKLVMLKRHIMAAYNMTPEKYREKWGLSSDYPMVAPNYATRRSQLAKNIGLGRTSKRNEDVMVEQNPAPQISSQPPAPKVHRLRAARGK
jgi:predicted transcriptional regulator